MQTGGFGNNPGKTSSFCECNVECITIDMSDKTTNRLFNFRFDADIIIIHVKCCTEVITNISKNCAWQFFHILTIMNTVGMRNVVVRAHVIKSIAVAIMDRNEKVKLSRA
jgi:hypothetical protein